MDVHTVKNFLNAARDGQLSDMGALLKLNPNFVNEKDVQEESDEPVIRKGATALIYAARNGHEPCVKLLMQNGAEIDVATTMGWTALHMAAYNGHKSCVKLLLQSGAAIDLTTAEGYTALFVAAYNGHESCVNILLQSGASIHLTTMEGHTALFAAERKGYESIAHIIKETSTSPEQRRCAWLVSQINEANKTQAQVEQQLYAVQEDLTIEKKQRDKVEQQLYIVQQELAVEKNEREKVEQQFYIAKKELAIEKNKRYKIDQQQQKLTVDKNEQDKFEKKLYTVQEAFAVEKNKSHKASSTTLEEFFASNMISEFQEYFKLEYGIIQINDFEVLDFKDWLKVEEDLRKANAFRLQKSLKKFGVPIKTHTLQQQFGVPVIGHTLEFKTPVKEFEFLAFLSHYKEEAGECARSLKVHIVNHLVEQGFLITKKDIYLDNDNLKDLTELLGAVKASKYLIFILTLNVLTRPWCLLELVTAHQEGKTIIPVRLVGSEEKQFDQHLLDCYKTDIKQLIVKTLTSGSNVNDIPATTIADTCIGKITAHGFTVHNVNDAVVRLSELISRPLDFKSASEQVLNGYLADITQVMRDEFTFET